MPVWLVGLRHLLRRFNHHDLAGHNAILRPPPLTGKMTPLQPVHVQPTGDLIEKNQVNCVTMGLALGMVCLVEVVLKPGRAGLPTTIISAALPIA
jgi:hypothetical protein